MMTERIVTQYDKEIARMGARGDAIRAGHEEEDGSCLLSFVADARRAAQREVLRTDADYEVEKGRLMQWTPKDV